MRNSDLCATIVALAKKANYAHESQKTFRHGYMAAVIKLGNIVNKHASDAEMKNVLESVEDWQDFVDGELKRSNEVNNKNLGG